MVWLAAHYRRRPSTMVKAEALRWPVLGRLIRWFGGIPIDRSGSYNMVDQVVDFINACDRVLLVITPEGTRSKIDHWRSGFYHIAWKAGIPIVPVYVDYKHKKAGAGRRFT